MSSIFEAVFRVNDQPVSSQAKVKIERKDGRMFPEPDPRIETWKAAVAEAARVSMTGHPVWEGTAAVHIVLGFSVGDAVDDLTAYADVILDAVDGIVCRRRNVCWLRVSGQVASTPGVNVHIEDAM